MTQATTEYVKQAEFARRRGVSRATVTEYKAKGLLVMTDDGLVDVAASEARLAASLDPVRGGDRTGAKKQPSADSRLAAARAEEAELRSARLRMELEKAAGNLVDADGVRRVGFTLARDAQEKLLAIADRLSSQLAVVSDAAKVHDMLTKELRLVCQELAKDARERIVGLQSGSAAERASAPEEPQE